MLLRRLLPLALVASALPAQGLVIPAPEALLRPFDLTGGTVQQLVLPMSTQAPFQVNVVLGDVQRTLLLRPHNILYPGAAYIHIDKNGNVTKTPLVSNTFRGEVAGVPGSYVAASLYHGQLEATVTIGDEVWGIEAASNAIEVMPHSAHIVYTQEQVRPSPYQCSVHNDVSQQLPQRVLPSARTNAAKRAVIAMEMTPNFVSAVGGRNNAINYAMATANGVSSIYNNYTVVTDFFLFYVMTRDAGYAGTNPTNIRNTMRSTWNGRAQELLTVVDMAQAWVPVLAGSVIGISFLPGACTSSRYTVCQRLTSALQRNSVSAHEFGHNLNAVHCDGFSGGCYVMCSVIGGCNGSYTRFGNNAQARINAYVNPRACFDN